MQEVVSITPALCVTHYTGTMSALLALGLFPAEVFPIPPKRTASCWLHAGRVVPAETVPRGYVTDPRHSVLCWVKRLKGGTFEVGVQHTQEQRQAAIISRSVSHHK